MSYFYLAMAMFIVGSSVIVGKILTYDFPLFFASGLRFLIAVLLLLPTGVYRRKLFCLSRHDWYIIFIIAFCGQILFTLLLLLGLRYTSGISTGTLTSTTPFFMALISLVFLDEKFSFGQVAGLLLAFSSIIFISIDAFKVMIENCSSDWLGNLVILMAVASEAIFLLFAKKLDAKLSGLELTAILSLVGFIMCLPLAFGDAVSFNYTKVGIADILAIIYFGAIYTDLAYICWFRGIAGTSSAVASAFTAIMPLSATLLATFMFKETISVWQIMALLTAVCSILVLATFETRKETMQ
ncbi:MAG: putative superfamily transporter inner rane protein [Firmicutes bacterium]|nr:putative superfamily transporter inner rane protein [Bacillota bacterium]